MDLIIDVVSCKSNNVLPHEGQEIYSVFEILDLVEYGKSLFIDNDLQVAESDEHIYSGTFVNSALKLNKTKDRAAKSINTYSKYFPTKENCFFNGIADGSSHTVECWINQTTNVRTSD